MNRKTDEEILANYHRKYTNPRMAEVSKQLLGATIFDVEYDKNNNLLTYGALLSVSLHCNDGIDRKLLITGDTIRWLAITELRQKAGEP